MKNFDPVTQQYVAQVENEKPRSLVVLEEVIEIDASTERNAFKLGRLYNEIVDNNYVKADQCANLKEFLMKRGIKLSEREIDYRRKIAKVAAQLDITDGQLIAATITKCKTIFKLNPQTVYKHETGVEESVGEIIKQLVAAAPDMSAQRLKEEVDMYLGKVDDPNAPVSEKFTFQKEEFDNVVDLAIKTAIRVIGPYKNPETGAETEPTRSNAIRVMSLNYVQDPHNREALVAILGESDTSVVEASASFVDEVEDSE